MAFSPNHTGLLAIGSYSQTTGIYREDSMELLYVLHGQEGGITHVSQHRFLFNSTFPINRHMKSTIFSFRSSFLKMEITCTPEDERCVVLTSINILYMIIFSFFNIFMHVNALKDPYIMCWDTRKAVEVVYK